MEYLVLRRFNSYGKLLIKGTVVDEREIRSPCLRMAEGKIIPAVSSLTVPVEPGDELGQPGIQGEEDIAEQPTEQAKQLEQPALQMPAVIPERPKLHFTLKG